MDFKGLLQLCFTVALCRGGDGQALFVQVGDIHIDPQYPVDGGLSCNKEIPESELLPNGHYECDLPLDAFQKALQYIMEQRQPEFVVWMGDNVYVPKPDGDEPDTETIKDILYQTTEIMKNVTENVQVIPLIGNHDYYPKDQLPGDAENDEIYDYLGELWAEWLGGGIDTFTQGGYYSIEVLDGLRVVVVNTNLYLLTNNVTVGQDDPGDQLQWLESELSAAQNKQEKVYIFMHVPPGAVEHTYDQGMIRPEYTERLQVIFVTYHEVIVAIFSAHEHTDAFRIFYDGDNPVVPMFLAPSLTPRLPRYEGAWARNSAIRRVQFNNDYSLHDINQYALFLNESENKQIWKIEYMFVNTYFLQDLTALSLHDLVERMYEFGSEMFHLYYGFNHVTSHYPRFISASCMMKHEHLCSMQYLLPEDYRQCVDQMSVTACRSPDFIYSLSLLGLVMIFHIFS